MSLQPRMLLLMIPPAAIVAAFGLIDMNVKRALFFSFSFMACGFWQYYIGSPNYMIYFALSILCFIFLFVKQDKYAVFVKISIVLVLFIHPLYSMVYNKINPELTGEKPLIDLLTKKKQEVINERRIRNI
jgi:hypothetical protein